MDQRVFERFRELIYRESGIALHAEKISLLSNRIQKRMRELKLSAPEDYLEVIETDLSRQELVALLDAISTNTTYFFRESAHFLTFQRILQEVRTSKRSKPLKIWCAASSTGEEPYTLAYYLRETLDWSHQSGRILATDISTRALERATAGVYSAEQTLKLPPEIRRGMFPDMSSSVFKEPAGIKVRIDPDLQALVLFKRLNLIQFPYPLKGPLDVVFCRNVMIYFDTPTRQRIVSEIERLLAPGGYLFLSHSENLLGITHHLTRVETSVFQKGKA